MNNLVARYKKILKNELIKAPLDTIKKIKQSLPPQSTAEMDEFLIHESNWTDLQERQRKGVISDQQYNLLRSHLFSRILLSIENLSPESLSFVQRGNIELQVQRFDGVLNSFFLLDNDQITVGRDIQNDIHLPEKIVSRFHCKLIVSIPKVQVIDLQSKNKIFLNGKQITRGSFEVGMTLMVGNTIFRILDYEKTD